MFVKYLIFICNSDRGEIGNFRELYNELMKRYGELVERNERLVDEKNKYRDILVDIRETLPVNHRLNINSIVVENRNESKSNIVIETDEIEGLRDLIGVDSLKVAEINVNDCKILGLEERTFNNNNVGGVVSGEITNSSYNDNNNFGIVGYAGFKTIVDVNDEVAANINTVDTIENVNNENKDLRKEVVQLQNDNNVKDATIHSLQVEVKNLMQEVESINEQKETLQNSLVSKIDQIEVLEGVIDEKDNDIDELNNEKLKVSEKLISMEAKYNSLNERYSQRLNSESYANNLEINRLMGEVDRLSSDNKRLFEKNREVEDKYDKLRSKLPVYVKVGKNNVIVKEDKKYEHYVRMPNYGEFDTLNRPNDPNEYYIKEESTERGLIPPVRVIDDRDYLVNVDLSDVAVVDKYVLNDYGVFESPFNNNISMSRKGYLSTANVDVNLEYFKREWYATCLNIISRKYDVVFINGRYECRKKKFADNLVDNDIRYKIGIKDEYTLERSCMLYNNLNTCDLKEIESHLIKINSDISVVSTEAKIYDNQGNVTVFPLNLVGDRISQNDSSNIDIVRKRRVRLPVYLYYDVDNTHIYYMFAGNDMFDDIVESKSYIFKFNDNRNIYYIGSDYYMSYIVEEIFTSTEVDGVEKITVDSGVNFYYDRKIVSEVECSNLNVALIQRGLPNQDIDDVAQWFGFNFIRYFAGTVGKITKEEFINYCDSRGVAVKDVESGPNELFEVSSYDKNKEKLFYLSYDITQNNRGICLYELFSKYKKVYGDRLIDRFSVSKEVCTESRDDVGGYRSFKFDLYYDGPAAYYDPDLGTYVNDNSSEYNLEKVFYGERRPVDEVELKFIVDVQYENEDETQYKYLMFSFDYVLLYDVLFDKVILLSFDVNNMYDVMKLSTLYEQRYSNGEEFAYQLPIFGGEKRGLYILDKGEFTNVGFKYIRMEGEWVFDGIDLKQSSVNVKFMSKTGSVVNKMKFDGISYGLLESMIEHSEDMGESDVEMFSYMRNKHLKLDINSKKFRLINNRKLLNGIIDLDRVQFVNDDKSFWFNYLITNGCMIMKGYSLNRKDCDIEDLFNFEGIELYSKEKIINEYRKYILLDYPNLSVLDVNKLLIEDDVMELIIQEKENNELVLSQVSSGIIQINSNRVNNYLGPSFSGVVIEDVSNEGLEINPEFPSDHKLEYVEEEDESVGENNNNINIVEN